MTFTAYAIRQKSTGNFLPMRFGTGRGYSYDVPQPCAEGGPIPRLFLTRRRAQAALSAWLQGKWSRGWHFVYSEGCDEETVDVEPVAGRVKEDMEVVPITIQG